MKGLIAGSFDPFHKGHLDIVERAARLFDTLYVIVAHSSSKQPLIPAAQRVQLIQKSLTHIPNVQVRSHDGLVTQLAHQLGVRVLVRGLRVGSDFEYEQSMEWFNSQLSPQLETVFLMTRPEWRFVSSRAIKELHLHGEPVDHFVPQPVAEWIKAHRGSRYA